MGERSGRRNSGFSGAVSVQTLPELVQLYALSGVSGSLQIHTEDGEGCVWFRDGEIVRASSVGPSGSSEGEEAFYAIMEWDHGEFTMRRDTPDPLRNVFASWQQLVMEGCRRKDESAGKTGGLWTQRPESNGGTLEPIPELDRIDGLFHEFLEQTKEQVQMNIKDSLSKLSGLDGFIGACLVDSDSGMTLGMEGGGGVLNLEVAAAGNTEVVRAKRQTMASLALKDAIEDILISLGKQYHLIRPLKVKPSVFFYVALDRSKSNLAMARLALADVEKDLQI